MLFLYLIDRLLNRACSLLGHCDDVHDTGLVRVRLCRYCRSFRVENYTRGVYDIYFVGDLDAAGRPTAIPRCVIVHEVTPARSEIHP